MNDCIRNIKIPAAAKQIADEISAKVYAEIRFESDVTQREVTDELLHQLVHLYGYRLEKA